MDWINLAKLPPKQTGQYLIHCTGTNVSMPYQIGTWDGSTFWSAPGNMQYPFISTTNGKITSSILVDYYAILSGP